MRLTKLHRLRLLFVSRLNPIWKDLHSSELSETDFYLNIGTSGGSVMQWKRGAAFKPQTMDKLLTKARVDINTRLAPEAGKPLLAKIEEFGRIYKRAEKTAERIDLYKAAAVLGLTLDQCQMIIDDAIYEHRPVFPAMYYDTTDTEQTLRAQRHLERYQGTYHLWLKRGDVWLQCPVRIRYLLTNTTNESMQLRAKLNVPLIHPEEQLVLKAVKREGIPPYFEYDGFVSVRRPHVFFMFEKRPGAERNDYFHFITDWGNTEKGKFVMRGTYLTVGGDDANRLITTGQLVMQRVAYEDPEELLAKMREPRILRGPAAIRPARILAGHDESKLGKPTPKAKRGLTQPDPPST